MDWRKIFILIIGSFVVVFLFWEFGNAPIWNFSIWNALVAIGSLGVIALSWYSIQRMRKERKIQLNREIIEKVYNPLFQDLNLILNLCRIENLEDISSQWKWETIKKENPYLVYQIELFDDFNEFSKKVKDYQKLKSIIKEKFENLLTKIVKDKEILSEEISIKKAENIYYSEGSLEDYKKVSILQLFFHSKNLKEFLNKSELEGTFFIDYFDNSGLQRKEINEEKFNRIWEEIAIIKKKSPILNRFGNNYLPNKEDVQKWKNFYHATESLRNKLDQIIRKLAQEK